MLTCKQVSHALLDRNYRDLPFLSRLGLRLHVALCIFCGRANRQVMVFQDGARAFLRSEERGGATAPRLDSVARERIKSALGGGGAKP